MELAALRGRTVLLKFYRFATCPVCNLHMHRFISEYDKLQALGLTTVVLYHSPADKLASENTDLPPFDLVADPGKRVFRAYGVENGLAGMFSFAVMRDYYRALKAGFSRACSPATEVSAAIPPTLLSMWTAALPSLTTAGITPIRSMRARLRRSAAANRLI